MIPFKSIHGILLPPIRTLARLNLHKMLVSASHPEQSQQHTFKSLLRKGEKTVFGRGHGFKHIRTHTDFCSRVPVMDYETLYPYIKRILEGEKNILWPGTPMALASTSGTSKGPIKYIPVTKASAPDYQKAARNSVLSYIAATGKVHILSGPMFFMSQNPEYERICGLPAAPISGVSMTKVPGFIRKNLFPSAETASIPDWESKLDAMLKEVIGKNLTLVSGIPPWLILFFNHIVGRTGKTVGEVFPDLEVIIHGGVNFEPYRATMEALIGRPVDFVETYAATEGFIGFQDDPKAPGMLINTTGNIFFEFTPADQADVPRPERSGLEDIELGRNYNILLTTTAGLWAYDIGDTVKFLSKRPYRLVVTGRSKHYISAFGEHMIAEHADGSLSEALHQTGTRVREYTIAPNITPADGGLPYHEWFIEFETPPENLERFAGALDGLIGRKNIIYQALVNQKIIRPLKVLPIRNNGFRDYMQSINKIGGQNKVPRLLNHRNVADAMAPYLSGS